MKYSLTLLILYTEKFNYFADFILKVYQPYFN